MIDKDNRCTMFPNGNWLACCIGHDYEYADGGNLMTKIKADIKLGVCVAKKGHPVIGLIMWAGVTFIPVPYWHFRWVKN